MGSHAEVEVPHDENDPFVKRVAMSVAVFAVVLAVAASGGNNVGKDMMMNQLNASNKWSHYQAKRQREVLLEQEREQYELTVGVLPAAEAKALAEQHKEADKDRGQLPADPAARRKVRHALVLAKLAEYQHEKRALSAEATGFENERNLAHKKDPYFDLAELLLQIGIVLASVAMLSKARWAFVGGCVLGVLGLLLTLNGYFMLVDLPFLSAGDLQSGQG